jgi:Domain of unknown function (DUF3850)
MTHWLKTSPRSFTDSWSGLKTFTARNNTDREFKVGNRVVLLEYMSDVREGNRFSGRAIVADVPYILKGGQFQLPANLSILRLSIISKEDSLPASWADEMEAAGKFSPEEIRELRGLVFAATLPEA